MAKSKHTLHAENAALAHYLARRVAESVPSASTYQSTIAATIADALTDAAAGLAEPDPATHTGSLDTD